MNLSKHFTLAELTISQEAARRGIDNTPSPTALANLKRVAAVLEEVRALFGMPIVVSSGYRSPELNAAIGGSRTSAHVLGLAADINCPGITPTVLARKIRDSRIIFDQLILEYPDRGGWVHIGLSEKSPREQLFTKRSGTGYMPGIA
ncbi:D-Ala-D-Ala carboxypeptidase family metallohydrolase [Oxalicibacterium faecigallinarum]|uniref:Peptidase M15 n=1 Tax=Oxalicibacterium faecigallinarum TaxID=573741 RepID=A0A8J3APG0_9BURK|nr:D-Ala-D-Ala carboxypeptidase family metallohydrolase [Oxalicibacterium faecigallinarum]GGI16470.1 peptidase M15 [Oxalicibacterium faecigallinarum]